MMKYLLLFGVLGLVYWFWRKGRERENPPETVKEASVDRMVRCDQCGVYLPESDSVRSGDAYFCNAAHRDAKQRKAP